MGFKYGDKVLAGVGVILVNENAEILLGKRQGSHGAGEWSLPGGHCEKHESSDDSAIREVEEEVGLKVADVEKITWVDHYFEENDRQYVTLYYIATNWEGEVSNMEPEKCEEWKWFGLHNLPDPLFDELGNVVKKHNDMIRWYAARRYMQTHG